jgi:hypothetical protein
MRVRRIFGPKREEVAGGWTTLHNEELHNLYASPNIVRMIESSRMKWEGHVARMVAMRSAYKTLVGKPERKRPVGKSRYRRKTDIRMDPKERSWEFFDWIHLTQDRDQ